MPPTSLRTLSQHPLQASHFLHAIREMTAATSWGRLSQRDESIGDFLSLSARCLSPSCTFIHGLPPSFPNLFRPPFILFCSSPLETFPLLAYQRTILKSSHTPIKWTVEYSRRWKKRFLSSPSLVWIPPQGSLSPARFEANAIVPELGHCFSKCKTHINTVVHGIIATYMHKCY